MFELDKVLDFSSASAETLFVDAEKIKRNYEMLSLDLYKISNPDEEQFVKIYLGVAGGQIRPVIASTKMLTEFIMSHNMITRTISENSAKIFTGEAETDE